MGEKTPPLPPHPPFLSSSPHQSLITQAGYFSVCRGTLVEAEALRSPSRIPWLVWGRKQGKKGNIQVHFNTHRHTKQHNSDLIDNMDGWVELENFWANNDRILEE
jgi:hypothetical protein